MKHEYVNIDDKKLYVEQYKEYDNRPTIVFLHDSLGAVQLWRDYPAKLGDAAQCNVLVYDRIGYGKSQPMTTWDRPVNYLEKEADVLNDLLTVLNIQQAILFGHSDGGSVALIAASKYPGKIKAIICEAAHIFVEDVTLQGIYRAIEDYTTTNLAERLRKYHGDKVKTLFKAWTETWTRADYRNWNIEHLLPAITCPVLFIQGDADEYGTLAQVTKTIELVRGKAAPYIIPNVGHTPHREAVELTIRVASRFIFDAFNIDMKE